MNGTLGLRRPTADPALAAGAAAIVGVGVLLCVLGAVARQVPLVLAGGAALSAALLVMFAARWVDGLVLLALTLPLPALTSGDMARLPPVAVLTALVVTAWVVRALPERRRIRIAGLPRAPVLLFTAAVLISSVFAIDRAAAARELVNLGTMLALLIVATDELGGRPEARRSFARLLAGVVGVAGFAALLESLGVLPAEFPLGETPFNRATIGFGWPNEAGMFFSVALPLSVYAYQSGRDRFERLAGRFAVVGCTLGLLATFSRASWLAALVAPAAMVLIGESRSTLRAWAIGALGIGLLDLLSGGALSTRAVSLVGDYVVEQRAALMYAGVLMFLDHPWVGIGLGGFVTALEQYGPQIDALWDYVGSAHNGYVEVAAEMGIVGVVGFVLLMGGMLRRLAARARASAGVVATDARALERAQLDRALFWAFATACLVTFTIWPFAHGMGQLLVLIAALGLAETGEPHEAGAAAG